MCLGPLEKIALPYFLGGGEGRGGGEKGREEEEKKSKGRTCSILLATFDHGWVRE